MSKAHLKDAVASSVGTLYYMSPERCLSNEYSFNAGIPHFLSTAASETDTTYHPQIFGLWVVAFMNLPLADIPLPLLRARPRT